MNWTKIVGACLILLSGMEIGFSEGWRLKERERALGNIARMLELLKEEIRYGNIPLREAFRRVGKKMPEDFRKCLYKMTEAMEKGGTDSFSMVFKTCAENTLGDLPLAIEEKEQLYAIGEFLGYLDLNAQLKELDRLQNLFQKDQDRVRQELPGKLKLYRSMGIIGAFLLLVLIW